MPDFNTGPRKSRGRLELEAAQAVAQTETVTQPEAQEAEAATLEEWNELIKQLEDAGAFDPQGRWTSIPAGTTREQVKFAEQLRAQRQAEAAVAEKPAEVTNDAVNAESLERDNFEPGLEIGKTYFLNIDGADEAFSYEGDDEAGNAVMVTQKGARLLKSRGLDEVKKMGEIYPNEFFRAVKKELVKDEKLAA